MFIRSLFQLMLIVDLFQGFRKYLTQSRDHEELLSFLLGQLVKDKARFYQLQRHQQPELVSIKVSELDERVRIFSPYTLSYLIPSLL